jgi:hypothetical protein
MLYCRLIYYRTGWGGGRVFVLLSGTSSDCLRSVNIISGDVVKAFLAKDMMLTLDPPASWSLIASVDDLV